LPPARGVFLTHDENLKQLFIVISHSEPRGLEQQQMKCFHAVLGAVCAVLAGCSPSMPGLQNPTSTASRQDSIERLVATVRKEPSKKPLLAKALMSGKVLVIPDPGSKSLALLAFDQPERSFIPVFSSRKIFDQEAYGTGFEGKAVSIEASRFASLLQGDEVVILNSGHRPAIEFRASELKAALTP
jgi:hypothetical protein